MAFVIVSSVVLFCCCCSFDVFVVVGFRSCFDVFVVVGFCIVGDDESVVLVVVANLAAQSTSTSQ